VAAYAIGYVACDEFRNVRFIGYLSYKRIMRSDVAEDIAALSIGADPWARTIKLLELTTGCGSPTDVPISPIGNWEELSDRLTREWRDRDCNRRAGHCYFPSVLIRVLERPTKTSAVIYWSEPGLCLYGYQQWRATGAPTDGRCALSGMPIRKGNRVFRPWSRECTPHNADAMVLASVMPVFD
jgi:Domain of unknown function (DUF3331)